MNSDYFSVGQRDTNIELEDRSSPRHNKDYSSVHQSDIKTADTNRTSNNQSIRSSSGCKMAKEVIIGVAIVGGIVALLLVILLPMSFQGVDYFQYGLKRRKSTGTVDRSVVYSAGKHAVGPDMEFLTFSAVAHYEYFDRITVFAADRLQVSISCNLQYFLRQHQLALLHKTFDIHYKTILKNNARDAIKVAATQFETREYIHDRERIGKALFKAVKERLGGNCCEKGCDDDETCVDGCIKPYERCKEADYGLFAEVRYFQLQELGIHADLGEKFLNQLIEGERNEMEKYNQESLIVRKETDGMVKDIENSAAEITHGAIAQSDLIRSLASANATFIVENSRSEGLKHLYSELGITDQQYKASFDYLRTLKGKSNVKLSVDYDTLITGSMP